MEIEAESDEKFSFSSDEQPIFSLTDNLGSSYVDENSLLHNEVLYQYPVGMGNFKSNLKNQIKPKIRKISSRERWQRAAMKIKLMKDPWAKFEIEKYPGENVVRHRYDPVKRAWKKDICLVKMEDDSFANGSMRECFRLKKLSNFSHDKCWKTSSNYVAKSYLSDDIINENYFDDVKVQMDAKLWAEIYNRFNPPKKIDMFQMCILEFKERPGSPLFHLEHYMQGQYIKYNSNAGFVDDAHLRNTPHAFSHFTFECSSHEQIVVDIQGVGDLYTDPQIHTSTGTDYGDGNLGIKGFALFFHSHTCNDICKSLGLSPFDLASTEAEELKNHTSIDFKISNITTKSRGDEEPLFITSKIDENRKYHPKNDEHSISEIDEKLAHIDLNLDFSHSISSDTDIVDSPYFSDEAFKYVNSKMFDKPRPSTVSAEMDNLFNSDVEYLHRLQDFSVFESILAKVHLELAKYHEIGRFLKSDIDEIDHESAFFHLQQSAKLGELDALVNLAKIYMQIPRDLLPEYEIKSSDANYNIGLDFMIEAAERGEKSAMHFIAKAFDTGMGLGEHKSIDWNKAVDFYRKILSSDKDETTGNAYSDPHSDFDSDYLILSRIGQMYLEGINGIEKNPQEASDLFLEAADKAVQLGKGRLANKYYNLSDEALALIDD